ncbi:hypothetical protein [Oceanithermus sp.]
MAKTPENLRNSKRKPVTDPREIPRQFRSLAAEAKFWESRDFAPGVLAEGERIRKELDELLGIEKQ